MRCCTRQIIRSRTDVWTGILVLSVIAAAAAAQESGTQKSSGASAAEFVQPFVRPTTCLIARIDPALMEFEKLMPAAASAPTAGIASVDRLRTLDSLTRQLRDLVDSQPVFATIGIPASKSRIPIRVFVRRGTEEKTERLESFLRDVMRAEVAIQGDYVVAMPPGTQPGEEIGVVSATESRPEISEAFQAVAGFPAQLLLIPPEYVWRTVRDLSPELPRQLGGGPSQVLTEGVRWMAVGFDPGQLRTTVVIQSATENAARQLADRLPVILRSALDAVAQVDSVMPRPLAQAVIAGLHPQVSGNRVTIRSEGAEQADNNLAVLASIASVIEERTRGDRTEQQLKQIMLGIHNYHDVHRSFPPHDSDRGPAGKSQLSWRVHILPFVGAEPLFREFRLDEPWDSPHNKRLLEKMPEVFVSPGVYKPGYTAYLAPVGEKTIFGQERPVQFHQITDGTANTIAVLEVVPERAVPWTAPDDFQFDPREPLQGLRRGPDGRWQCAFADGSVRRITGSISPATVLNLFQMSDGNPINNDEL